MKRALKITAIGVSLVVIGFFTGRIFQHLKSGYHYKILDAKEIPSSLGTIEWKCVAESVGMPFMDPGTTIINFQGRTIFKAQRIFQESFPYARNIQTTNGSIDWDDGELKYHLTIGYLTNPPSTLQTKLGTITN